MAGERSQNKYLVISLLAHVVVLLLFVLSFEYASTLPVVENTNKTDVISAVVLGDTAKSKILPTLPPPKPIQPEVKTPPKDEPKPQEIKPAQVDKDVIALKAAEKKKLAEKKALEAKKQRDLFAQDLLADLKKQADKSKKVKQKQLKTQFEKTLHEQAEKSLRQNLLNEDIKLQGAKSRQSQGEVNKYKALILQAISEHWVIPPGVNKKLSAELLIRLAPGGVVLDVQVTRSSGDPSLDSSARAAVMKSSPLPVPAETDAFEAFRQFALKVKPENVLASE